METAFKFQQMNLELTTVCPLRCPQCYCSLEGGKHLDIEIAKRRIDEACKLGLKILDLSGGETMCYPDLYELIRYASQRVKIVDVALSGALFNQEEFEKLVNSGITGISISLNGSTEQINALSREGYGYAIKALELLRKNRFSNTTINWVMHSNNADDFMNLVKLAEKYHVSPAQICLRYSVQRGIIPLPKSSSMERMIQNQDLFSFEIEKEDMYRLETMPQAGWSGEHPDRERVYFE